MNALRAELSDFYASDIAENIVAPDATLVEKAIGVIFEKDAQGIKIRIEVSGTPYDALIRFSEELRAYGFSNNMAQDLIEAFEAEAIHQGVDFTQTAKPTPMTMEMYIADKKPDLDPNETHSIIAYKQNGKKIGGDYSKMVMKLGLRGTETSQTNVPNFDEMFVNDEKHLIIHLKKLTGEDAGVLDQKDVAMATLVEAVGPVAAESRGAETVKQSIEAGTIRPEMMEVISKVATINTLAAEARAPNAPAEVQTQIAQVKTDIINLTSTIAKTEAIPSIVAKAIVNAYEQTAPIAPAPVAQRTLDMPKADNTNVPSAPARAAESVFSAPAPQAVATLVQPVQIQTQPSRVDAPVHLAPQTLASPVMRQDTAAPVASQTAQPAPQAQHFKPLETVSPVIHTVMASVQSFTAPAPVPQTPAPVQQTQAPVSAAIQQAQPVQQQPQPVKADTAPQQPPVVQQSPAVPDTKPVAQAVVVQQPLVINQHALQAVQAQPVPAPPQPQAQTPQQQIQGQAPQTPVETIKPQLQENRQQPKPLEPFDARKTAEEPKAPPEIIKLKTRPDDVSPEQPPRHPNPPHQLEKDRFVVEQKIQTQPYETFKDRSDDKRHMHQDISRSEKDTSKIWKESEQRRPEEHRVTDRKTETSFGTDFSGTKTFINKPDNNSIDAPKDNRYVHVRPEPVVQPVKQEIFKHTGRDNIKPDFSLKNEFKKRCHGCEKGCEEGTPCTKITALNNFIPR